MSVVSSPGAGSSLVVEPIRAELRQWLEANWSTELTVRQWWRLLADSGWGFPGWPQVWCGKALDLIDQAVVVDELERWGALAPPASGGQRLAAPTILQHGTEEQKSRLIPLLARGEEAWCQLFSEPDAGSDLGSVRTRGVQVGDKWIVNGQKVWTSGAQASDRGFMLMRTGSIEERHRGLTFCIVDFDQPGVTVMPLKQITGESAFNQVFLENVVVEGRDVIGEPGDGWSVALTTLGHERQAVRSSFLNGYHWSLSPFGVPGRRSPSLDQPIGVLRDASKSAAPPRSDIDEAFAALWKLAVRTGQADRPEVSSSLADLFIRTRIAHYAKSSSEAHGAGSTNGSVRKLLAAQMASAARETSVRLAAGAGLGVSSEREVSAALEAIFLSSPLLSIAGGTDEIQKNVLAERVLGLPREARAQERTHQGGRSADA